MKHCKINELESLLEENIDKLERIYDSHDLKHGKINELEFLLEEFRKREEENIDKLERLSESHDLKHCKINSLESLLEKNIDNLERLSVSNEYKSNIIDELENELDRLLKLKNDVECELDLLKSSHKMKDEDLESKHKIIQELNTLISIRTNLADQLQNYAESLNEKIISQEIEINELSSCKEENSKLRSDLSNLSNLVVDLRQIIESYSTIDDGKQEIFDAVNNAELIRELTSLSKSLDEQLNITVSENNNLRNENVELREIISNEKMIFNTNSVKSSNLYLFVSKLQNKLSEIRGKDVEHEEVFVVLNDVKSLEDEIIKLSDSLKFLNITYEDSLSKLESEIVELKSSLCDHKSKLECKEVSISKLESELDEQKFNISKLEGLIMELESDKADLYIKLNKSSETISRLVDEVENYKYRSSLLDLAWTNLELMNIEKDKYLTVNDELNLKINVYDDQISFLEKIVEKNNIEIDSLEKINENKEESMKVLIENLKLTKEISTENLNLRGKINSRDNEIEELQEELLKLKMHISKLSVISGDSNSSNTSFTSSTSENSDEEIRELTSQLIKQKINYNNLNDQLQESMTSVITYQSNIVEMESLISSLKQQLYDSTKELESSKEDRDLLIEAIQKEIDENKKLSNDSLNVMKELESAKEDRDLLIEAIQKEISSKENYISEIKVLNQIISSSNEQIQELKSLENKEVIKDSDSLEKDENNITDTIDSDPNENSKDLEIERLTSELSSEKLYSKSLKDRCNIVMADIETLSDDYLTMKEKLETVVVDNLNYEREKNNDKIVDPIVMEELEKYRRTNEELVSIVERCTFKINQLIESDFPSKIKDLVSSLLRIESEANMMHIKYLEQIRIIKISGGDSKKQLRNQIDLKFADDGGKLEDEKNVKLKYLSNLLDIISSLLRSY